VEKQNYLKMNVSILTAFYIGKPLVGSGDFKTRFLQE